MPSSCLCVLALADDLPRIIHHLGPRYMAHFQAQGLHAFLTYEASTSLNIYLAGLVAQRQGSDNLANQVRSPVNLNAASTLRALADGIGISEDAFVFSVSPLGYKKETGGDADAGVSINPEIYIQNGVSNTKTSSLAGRIRLDITGDIFPVTRECLDISLSRIGGASIILYLIEQASVCYHALYRLLWALFKLSFLF